LNSNNFNIELKFEKLNLKNKHVAFSHKLFLKCLKKDYKKAVKKVKKLYLKLTIKLF